MHVFRIPSAIAAAALIALPVISAVSQAKPPAPPVRIVTDTHFGVAVPDPATKKAQDEERADMLAFLFWQAGVNGFQP